MIFLIFASFLFGSAVGSFLNVVIDRTTRRESILGRSYCDHCKVTLSTVDLIPIISFVAQGAKCRYCSKPLSYQYPIVEGITALLFALTFYFLAVSGTLSVFSLVYYVILVSVMIVVAVVDFKFSLVPTTFVFAASLLALLYNFIFLSTNLFIEHVIAAFLGGLFFLIIVLVTRGKGMGEGDIIIGFLIGMVLGIQSATLAIFLAFLIGSVVSLSLIAVKLRKFGQTVPFAPFLVIGFFISFYWGEQLLKWYLMIY